MSVFSDLMSKVLGSKAEAKDEGGEATPGESGELVSEAAAASEETVAAEAAKPETPEAESAEKSEEATADSEAEVVSKVDVEAMLDEMAKEQSKELAWRISIVDLLELLGLDNSYGARKEMALELGYSQDDIDSKGSAEMNIWLHRKVMEKFAENGGKVPADPFP